MDPGSGGVANQRHIDWRSAHVLVWRSDVEECNVASTREIAVSRSMPLACWSATMAVSNPAVPVSNPTLSKFTAAASHAPHTP